MSKIANTQQRLWQLISPTLPIGAYSYSQGLEYAIEAQWVYDEASTTEWVLGQTTHNMARLDIAVLGQLHQAWETDNKKEIQRWNQFLLCSRESYELLEEDKQIGFALARLLADLGIDEAYAWQNQNTSFANMFALGGYKWNISIQDLARGYLWAWAENQVAAAIKLIPLGQTAGQRILFAITDHIHQAGEMGLSLKGEDIGFIAPRVSVASALHETQYTRLFRS